jgi:hypothetical protein
MPRPAARLLGRLAAACYPFEGKSPGSLVGRLGDKPVLVVHGVEDQILPFEAALDVYQRLAGRARVWLVAETGHAQEPALVRGPEYAAQLADFLDGAFAGRRPLAPAVRVSIGPGARPGAIGVRACLEQGARGSAAEPTGPVLLTIVGGGVLRQILLEGPGETVLEHPGPIESTFALRVLHPAGDAAATRYVSDGYQTTFRAMVQAVNQRRLRELDAALEAHMRLARDQRFDFFAALYSLRAAQAALGMVPGWRERNGAIAERSLERFLALWASNPALPGEDVATSPARWAGERRRQLAATADGIGRE